MSDQSACSGSLGNDLAAEIVRVRDKVLPARLAKTNPRSVWGASVMRLQVDRAEKAMADGDAFEMMLACQDLKEWRL